MKPPSPSPITEVIGSRIDDIQIKIKKNKKSIKNHIKLEYILQKAGKDHDLKKIRKNLKDLSDAVRNISEMKLLPYI